MNEQDASMNEQDARLILQEINYLSYMLAFPKPQIMQKEWESNIVKWLIVLEDAGYRVKLHPSGFYYLEEDELQGTLPPRTTSGLTAIRLSPSSGSSEELPTLNNSQAIIQHLFDLFSGMPREQAVQILNHIIESLNR